MSYRIYVNDYQCLGNNECPKVLIDELERQGCKFDGDMCFDFEVKELQPIIEALEKYIIETNEHFKNRGKSIADYSDILEEEKEKYGNGLTWRLQEIAECGYLFTSVNFLKAIKDDYEEYFDKDDKDHRIKYKIKEGHHVYMSGY